MIKYKPKTTQIVVYERHVTEEHDVYFNIIGHFYDEHKANSCVNMLTEERLRVNLELENIRDSDISFPEKNKKYLLVKNKYFPKYKYHEYDLNSDVEYYYEYSNELNIDKEIAIYELTKE